MDLSIEKGVQRKCEEETMCFTDQTVESSLPHDKEMKSSDCPVVTIKSTAVQQELISDPLVPEDKTTVR